MGCVFQKQGNRDGALILHCRYNGTRPDRPEAIDSDLPVCRQRAQEQAFSELMDLEEEMS